MLSATPGTVGLVQNETERHDRIADPWHAPGMVWSARRAGHADILRETFDGQESA